MRECELLRDAANRLRLDTLDMVFRAGSGHLGGSLSCAEIIAVLYQKILKIDSPEDKNRDRFILSKGHGAPMLYAALAMKGFIPRDELFSLRDAGSRLQGHPCMFKLPGVDISTGSLGMGISAGVGMALAARVLKSREKIYVLCGDGEMQEGENWEALMSASKWKLSGLTVIIDYNRVQLDGTQEEIMPLGDIEAKIKAFGLFTIRCDGHNAEELLDAFDKAEASELPSVIIADTVKGRGVSFMEGKAAWHGKPMSPEEYADARKEVEEAMAK